MSMQRAATAALLVTTAMVMPAAAQNSIQRKTQDAQAQIPTCSRRLGALAVRQPQNNWWAGLGLESPEAVIKILVQQSGCFTLVDRGAGFELAQQERALAAGGQLQGGANIGGGQIRAADYILVPDIVNKNGNSSGTNIGGALGGLLGGFAGAIVANISINSSTADVTLAMTNVRTTEQEAMTQGHGSKTDIGFGGGVGGFWGGFAGLGAGSYAKTAIGQVVVLAYIDAYTKLVNQMGGLSAAQTAGGAAAAAPSQTLTMSRPGRLYSAASDTSAPVRQLDPGMALYPTGNRNGIWVEVNDEVGNKGWVPQTALSNAK
ncbi:MAG: peptidoglycan-binding protein [Alphaproteobacteria bacterium]|nr:peptidoglycan-binding protein [Alphaproteobacteria bacterium]